MEIMKKNLFIIAALLIIGMLLLSTCAEGIFGSLEELEEQAIEENSGGRKGPLTGTVSINGIPRAGETLTAVTSDLGGNGDISYQWSRCDDPTEEGIYITDATESSYQLVPEDIGKYIRVTVTRVGNTGSVTSAATGEVESAIIVINIPAIQGVTAPVTGGTPVTGITENTQYTGSVSWTPAVSGTFAAGTTYTATITLTPKTGYTFTGVGANFFTVAGATATNPAGTGNITAVFPATSVPLTGSVSISGTARAGETLTAVTGSLEGSGTISYQWKRGDTAGVVETIIVDATANTYSLVPEDIGKYITVTVTRANNTGSVTSSAAGPVESALIVINVPGILGVTAPVT